MFNLRQINAHFTEEYWESGRYARVFGNSFVFRRLYVAEINYIANSKSLISYREHSEIIRPLNYSPFVDNVEFRLFFS